jgi:hypothetical protein
MPRFDTSFNFGANVAKPKAGKGQAKKGGGKVKRPKMGGSSKSRRYFAGMHGS